MAEEAGNSLHNYSHSQLKELRVCSYAYESAVNALGGDVVTADREQKLAQRHIAEEYLRTYYREDFYADYRELPDDRLWEKIKANALLWKEYGSARESEFAAFVETLDPEKAREIRSVTKNRPLLEAFTDYAWAAGRKELSLVIDTGMSFELGLVLTDVVWEGESPENPSRGPDAFLELFAFSAQKVCFDISPNEFSPESGAGKSYAASFNGIRIRKRVYDALRGNLFFPGVFPYNALFVCARDIVDKAKADPELINEKERELMPLIRELASLWLPEKDEQFPLLSRAAREHGLDDLPEMLVSLKDANEHDAAHNKLCDRLAQPQCEQFALDLFAEIAETQKDYPTRPVKKETARAVEDELRALGYTGSFPEFRKRGTTKGALWEQGRRISGGDAEFCVYCDSRVDGTLAFYSGIHIKDGPDGVEGGIFSCLFTEKRKRMISNFTVDAVDLAKNDVREYARIAAKRAELKKRGKSERKLVPDKGSGVFGFAGTAAANVIVFVSLYILLAFFVSALILIGGLLISLIKLDISFAGSAFVENWRYIVILPLIGLAVMFAFATVKAFKYKR